MRRSCYLLYHYLPKLLLVQALFLWKARKRDILALLEVLGAACRDGSFGA